MKQHIIFQFIIALITYNVYSQELIQVSGTIKDIENTPIPFARVMIPNTNKGIIANGQGFYSIVLKKGEFLQGECIGFKSKKITVPFDQLKTNHYYTDIQLDDDTAVLRQVVIKGFTEKELKELFIKTEIPDDLQSIGEKNVTPEELAKNNGLQTTSGASSYINTVNSQVQTNYYAGGQRGGINLLGLAVALPRMISYMKQQKREQELKRGQKYIR